MTKSAHLAIPQHPFVLFSMGLGGYEGECDLWSLPKTEITVYHVLARIKHEMKLLGKRTGDDFYLFGTSRKFVGAKEKFVGEYGEIPIDVFFTVNLRDLDRLPGLDEPSPEHVKRSPRRWRTMVNEDTNRSEPIPKEIHLWGEPDKAYYGLSIASLQVFAPKDERSLAGKHLCHYRRASPVGSWSQFRMGTLYVDRRANPGSVQDRRILATAKLMPPYIYEIRR